jgi:ATP/maltotriose-dependent transcriptional regulator MalT
LELAAPEEFVGVFVEQGPPVAEALAKMVEKNELGNVEPEYVERILAVFSGFQPPGAIPPAAHPASGAHVERPAADLPPGARPVTQSERAALIEPLTDREKQVLSLIAEGLKYREIAARLYISLNTVRFHVKAIYGKLNVNNRTKAVERARQLEIL